VVSLRGDYVGESFTFRSPLRGVGGATTSDPLTRLGVLIESQWTRKEPKLPLVPEADVLGVSWFRVDEGPNMYERHPVTCMMHGGARPLHHQTGGAGPHAVQGTKEIHLDPMDSGSR
jgi:hypothetical protein